MSDSQNLMANMDQPCEVGLASFTSTSASERQGDKITVNTHEGPVGVDNGVGLDCGSGGWAVWREWKGEITATTVTA